LRLSVILGVSEFKNKLGVTVVGLDYVANPAKRSAEWEAKTREGMDERAWRKEFKRDWTIASGMPVYALDFVADWHVSSAPLLYNPALPMYRGWDIGPTHNQPACCIAQWDGLRRLDVISEIVTWDGRGDSKTREIPDFADDVLFYCKQHFPDVSEWVDISDPAGWTPSMTDGKSAIMILEQKGIHPRRGPVTFTERKQAILDILCRSSQGRSAMAISPQCRMIIEGFQGAYKYEQVGETKIYKATVDKNAWSHIMNALEYIVGSMFEPVYKQEHQEYREEDDEPIIGRAGRYY